MSPALRRGVIGAGVLGVGLGLAGVVVLAQVGGDALVPHVESFWPTSAVTWLAIVGGGITVWRFWRDRQHDTTEERDRTLAKAIEPVSKQMAGMVTHYDTELARIERVVETTANGLRTAITSDINGWSRRIEIVERGQEAQNDFNESVVRFMGQSETDRANLTRQLASLTQTVDRMRETMDEKMSRILDALVALKGGRNA